MTSERIARTIVHHGLNDPRTTTGGVETFARNLAMRFEEVLYMTPRTIDVELVRSRRLAVICDNHHVLDWPPDIPLIGFQHGAAFRKMFAIPNVETAKMALSQRRAAKRPNTLWVSCARWMSRTFETLHDNPASKTVYHAVDLERFDGRLDNEGSRLLLHDGRFPHKGSELYPQLIAALPDWRFEPLDCKAEQVPDRLRKARAFLHLSRYEGNSIVCNEAMAMDLPCLFTRVGLMLDGEDLDVAVIEPNRAFDGGADLVQTVADFLAGLEDRRYRPRRWVLANASPQANHHAWLGVMEAFDHLSGWSS